MSLAGSLGPHDLVDVLVTAVGGRMLDPRKA
jgi:hypothetical protein